MLGFNNDFLFYAIIQKRKVWDLRIENETQNIIVIIEFSFQFWYKL